MLTGSLWIVRSVPSINDKFSINYPNMEAAVDALIANADRYGAKLLLVGMMNGEKDLPTTYTGGTATTAANSRSEEHTSELQSLMRISYAVFCLKKKKHQIQP